MLRISNEAATLLGEARRAAELPDSFGLRVYAQAGQDLSPEIRVGFAPEAEEGDEVSEQKGMHFWVAHEVAAPLSDALIDVETGDVGPQLILRPQDEEDAAK